MSGAVPVLMGLMIDEETCDIDHCGAQSKDGSIAQGTFLFVTAGFGFLSVLPYVSLISQFPKPKPQTENEAKVKAAEEDDKLLAAFWEENEAGKENASEHLRWCGMEKRSGVNKK